MGSSDEEFQYTPWIAHGFEWVVLLESIQFLLATHLEASSVNTFTYCHDYAKRDSC